MASGRSGLALLLIVAAVGLLVALVPRAEAAVFTVTDVGDASDAVAGNGVCAGAGPHTFTPASAYPSLTESVVIDGTTEPDYAVGAPVVVLAGCPACANGLRLFAGTSSVKGLVIHSFPLNGIYIQGGSTHSIKSNFIGTDVTGTLDLCNAHGIFVDGMPSNIIGGAAIGEGNVISGNNLDGVRIIGAAASGNTR